MILISLHNLASGLPVVAIEIAPVVRMHVAPMVVRSTHGCVRAGSEHL